MVRDGGRIIMFDDDDDDDNADADDALCIPAVATGRRKVCV
jgi:hypothetical protein